MKTNNDNTSLFDLIFNIALGFVLMFTIAVISMQIKKRDADLKKPKAEFLITLTWESGSGNDIDLWIRNPKNKILCFKAKDVDGIMHLDRDDLGKINDVRYENGVEKVILINQEIATIRGFIVGEWIVNAHFYKVNSSTSEKCTVTITKLNPTATVILSKSFVLTKAWEEKTIAQLTMTDTGKILNIEENIPTQLVKSTVIGAAINQ